LATALVTGSPERVPDITIALKSAGFEILAAGEISPGTAAEFLPLLAPTATVLVVAEAAEPVEEIAPPAGRRPPEPLPWWHYASIDPDLDFADWRNTILCLTSSRDA
jgi:hypothetical protein